MKRTTASGVQKYFTGAPIKEATPKKESSISYKPGEMAKIFKRHLNSESAASTIKTDTLKTPSLPYIMPTSNYPESNNVKHLFDLNVIFSEEVRDAMNLHALEFYKYLHELSQQAADPLTQMTSDDYTFHSPYFRNKVVTLIKTAQNTGTEICCERLGYFLLFDRLVQIYNFEPKAFRGFDPLEIRKVFPADLSKYVYQTFCYVKIDENNKTCQAKLHAHHKSRCLIYLIICSILVQNLDTDWNSQLIEHGMSTYKLDSAPLLLNDLEIKPKALADFCTQHGLDVNYQSASKLEIELVAPLIISKPVIREEPSKKKKRRGMF